MYITNLTLLKFLQGITPNIRLFLYYSTKYKFTGRIEPDLMWHMFLIKKKEYSKDHWNRYINLLEHYHVRKSLTFFLFKKIIGYVIHKNENTTRKKGSVVCGSSISSGRSIEVAGIIFRKVLGENLWNSGVWWRKNNKRDMAIEEVAPVFDVCVDRLASISR